ncbi:MAG: TIGR00296 family protein [Candidatus Aenigmarchaeota archaeon]|nr:TIGR00296 family protein [Candidatus Aenigmarchaeota archaeon]
MKFSVEDGKILIDLARKAIRNYFESRMKISPPKNLPKKFYEKFGVFVTLEKNRELRGCIGFPFPTKSLIEGVIDSALDSAFADGRFPPLQESELKDISMEVSILGEFELLKVNDSKEYLDKIEIGKHGLVVERGWFSGLLLPQVALDWNMEKEEFLSHTCLKAGLPSAAWKDLETKVHRFSALVFSEKEPNGEVIRKI